MDNLESCTLEDKKDNIEDINKDELISELTVAVMTHMATIGELEKMNTFLRYKLRFQMLESENAAKKAQEKISKLQEELSKMSKTSKETTSSPSKSDPLFGAQSHDPTHMQRWPEVLQNPVNALKLPPRQQLAAPRNIWIKNKSSPNRASGIDIKQANNDGAVEDPATSEEKFEKY